VANDVVLNQVIVDFGYQARTSAVIAAVQEEGTCWCGPTTWRGAGRHAGQRELLEHG
jgi:uncharacterized protein YciW